MSSSETYYWHDYETSGADPASDRPMQFAGLRTDLAFNPVGEPLVQYVKPTADCLPHPAAIRVTGIKPSHALREGVVEARFIARIHEELALPGTCGVGYNSIRFDDEITRYTLYRNFFDPYTRERQQGRSRWDLIDVTRAQAALRPEGVEWPRREDGYLSFRLEHLTQANGIAHGNAHDALADVEATIALARRLRQAQPALFDALYALRTPQAVAPLLDSAAMRPVIHVSGLWGAQRHNLAVVVPLAVHPMVRNEMICADLSMAPDFLDTPPTQLAAQLFAPIRTLPPGSNRPPLCTIKLNRAPAILPMSWLAGETAERLGLDGNTLRQHLAVLRARRSADPRQFVEHVQAIYRERTFPERSDPDEMLYTGFLPPHDTGQFADIRAASAAELASSQWIFRDARLPELLFRYRARNYPESLSLTELAQWREHCKTRLCDPEGFNLARFKAELSEVLADVDLAPRQRAALDDLEQYARQLCLSLGLSWP